MGVFDSLEEAAGLGAPAPVGRPGVVGVVLQMLQSQPGGVAGVVQKFESASLGGLASSWTGSGANQPVYPGQVQTALGSGPVAQIAEALGLSHAQAAGHIGQLLPMIIDHLTPNGQAAAASSAPELSDLWRASPSADSNCDRPSPIATKTCRRPPG